MLQGLLAELTGHFQRLLIRLTDRFQGLLTTFTAYFKGYSMGLPSGSEGYLLGLLTGSRATYPAYWHLQGWLTGSTDWLKRLLTRLTDCYKGY